MDERHLIIDLDAMVRMIKDAARHDVLLMWTIFDRPSDHPDSCVMRPFAIVPGDPEPRPLPFIMLADELGELSGHCEDLGMERIPRSPGDESQIVEIWL